MNKRKWLPFVIAGGVLTVIGVMLLVGIMGFSFLRYVNRINTAKQEMAIRMQQEQALEEERKREAEEQQKDSSSVITTGNGAGNLYLGTIAGNTYYNDYIGFTYVMPAGWHFATAEERAQSEVVDINNLTKDEITEIDKKVKNCYPVKILLAMNENGSANTMITLAGFSDLTQGIMNNMESVSEIEDFLTDRHLEEYRKMYEESDDAELLSIEKIPLLIGGEEKNAVKIHVIEGGVEQYILIWLYYKDGHMYMVWTASGGEDLVEGFLGNYYRDQSGD